MRTTSSHQEPLIGKIIGGRYEVVRLIGQGATGNVYEVRSTRLARSFAMKTLTSEAAGNARTLQRFRREADVIARLKHPNIVEVIDWEALDDGSPAMVMEYLRGEDLAQRIEGGPLAWPLIARMADEMMAALSVAHANGIVHRDLKPENVFLALDDAGDERVKLLDFGVSKVRDSKGFVTTDDTVLGTPAYMSPEQADGRVSDIGTHSDVWAIGAILFEMATGKVAFSAPSVPSILYKICHGSPASLLEHRPDAPPAFVELVAATFTRETDRRIADVAVLRDRLRKSLRDVPGVRFAELLPAVPPITEAKTEAKIVATIDATPGATTTSTPDRGVTTPTLMRRRRLAPVAVAMVVLAATVVVAAIVVATRDRPTRASAAIATPREAVEVESTADAGLAVEVQPPDPPSAISADVPREPARHTPPAQRSHRTKPRNTSASPVDPAPATPSVELPRVTPHKKPCAKDDVECLYGDGT